MARKILIAGGNSGMGLETVKRLTQAGDEVICVGRSHDNLEGMSGVTTAHFDATESEVSFDLPDELDGFVYFPGTITLKPLKGLKDEDYLQDFEINLLGAVRILRKAAPALKKSGSASVVLFSTVAVQTGLKFHASIAAAKGAVEGYARSLAAELAPEVRVNCIAPSLTDTPMASRLLENEAKQKAASERHPLNRYGSATENAELIQFLLSDASGFMTGQILKPDGGMSVLRGL